MSTSYGPDLGEQYQRMKEDHQQERGTVLTQAAKITTAATGARNISYGSPEDNFQRIANHWSVFLKNRFEVDVPLEPADVAAIMVLMKVARLEFKMNHLDSWVDIAGYADCGAVCANAK